MGHGYEVGHGNVEWGDGGENKAKNELSGRIVRRWKSRRGVWHGWGQGDQEPGLLGRGEVPLPASWHENFHPFPFCPCTQPLGLGQRFTVGFVLRRGRAPGVWWCRGEGLLCCLVRTAYVHDGPPRCEFMGVGCLGVALFSHFYSGCQKEKENLLLWSEYRKSNLLSCLLIRVSLPPLTLIPTHQSLWSLGLLRTWHLAGVDSTMWPLPVWQGVLLRSCLECRALHG